MNPLILVILGAVIVVGLSSGGGSIVDQAVTFIAGLEGFRATPYWDVRQWSIGYGTRIGTDRTNKPNVTWTRDQAKAALKEIVNSDYARLQQMITRDLTANQWQALLSFSYNLGVSGSSQIIARINQGLPAPHVSDAMKQYVYVDGVVSQALIDRRAKESNLFLT